MIPSLGRTVHYVLSDDHRHKGQHRAAYISQVWTEKPGGQATEETPCQLHVLSDMSNDGVGPIVVIRMATQDPFGKQPGSWHEPERAIIPEAKKPERRELAPA